MTTLIFDLESDGLLDTITTVHSLVLKDVETGEVTSCAYTYGMEGRSIEAGLHMLMEADLIVGHNIIKFDLVAIQKIFPWFTYDETKVFDTLVASRLIWTNLVDTDMARIRKGKTTLTPKLAGSHSLEAWGHRVGKWKGDYSKIMEERGLDPWASWNPEMQSYCVQDVEVTETLYQLILEKDYSAQAIELEHQVAFVIAQMERNGFRFDVPAAEKLYVELSMAREELGEQLRTIFKPWYAVDGNVVTPKRLNSKLGYWGEKDEEGSFHGFPYQKVKEVVFNPNSRDQIANRLMALYGWKPIELTGSGKAKVDETVLEALPYAEAKELARYMTLQKRIGQLAEGDNAWLKKVEGDGRIHGSVITNGAVTGRATHSHPNIGQVPKVGSIYGAECRALFTAVPGKTLLLGCDVSGLELRMLGHFMAKHDGGAYGREVIEGDVHTINQQAAGLPDRDVAKEFIYAFLYGAGDGKIGSIIGKGRMAGRAIKAKFFKKVPALKKLVDGVKKAAQVKGFLKGLDGRLLHIRSDHAALNTLLQSAGALVCKQWIVEFDRLLRENSLQDKVKLVAWVHDELQMEVCKSLVSGDNKSVVGDLCVEAIVIAGNKLGIRVPLTGEYKIGNNWKETH